MSRLHNIFHFICIFRVKVGAFTYFTLPSRDPVDLSVEKLEMQQTKICTGRCSYIKIKPIVLQPGALVFDFVANKDCVKCPDYSNLNFSGCALANQTVPD